MHYNNPILVPVIATDAAGKTEISGILKNQYRCHHYSVRDVLYIFHNEVHERDPATPEELTDFANEIRKIHGVHILPFNIVNVKIWHRPGIHIIESIRCVGELKYILGLEKDGYIVKPIGIDAPFETRYNRMLKRGDIKTPKSLEEFIERQNAEWDQPEPYMQNIKECLALLDPQAVFQNLDGELSATVGRIWNYLNA